MQRPPRAPTLKEIAEQAGVHVSTASRVLRQDEPVDGWSESALRVREVAAELGYQRNLWAASLRTRRTTTLGLVMPRLTDGVVATTYQGVEEAATRAGYSVLLSSPPDDLDAQRRSAELLIGRQVDGLVLSGLHVPGQRFVESLSTGTLPILTMTRHGDAGLPFVGGDDRLGGRLAAQHLLERGYRELAIIAGPEHATTARDRVQGFIDHLTEQAVTMPPEHLVHSDFEVDGGVTMAHTLLDRPNRPRAIFAVTDTLAIGALGAARDLALSVPDDVAIIGYNDVPIAAQLPLPLTTVHSPAKKIGATAVAALLEMIRGNTPTSSLLPVEVVPRATT